MTTPWVFVQVLEWIALGCTLLICIGLLRRVSLVLESVDGHLRSGRLGSMFGGLAVGATPSEFEVMDTSGRPVRSDALLRGRLIVLFLDPHCEPCDLLATKLDGYGGIVAGLPLIVITQQVDAQGETSRVPEGARVYYDELGRAAKAFLNIATPHAYVLDEQTRVAAKSLFPESATSIEQIVHGMEGGDISRSVNEVRGLEVYQIGGE